MQYIEQIWFLGWMKVLVSEKHEQESIQLIKNHCNTTD